MLLIQPTDKNIILNSLINLKSLFIDFDGTLVDTISVERISLLELIDEYQISEKQRTNVVDMYIKINNEVWTQFELNQTSIAEVQILRFKKLIKSFPRLNDDPKILNHKYSKYFIKNTTILSETINLLKKLKKLNIEFHILTNGIHWIQHERLKKIGILKLLTKERFYSSESVNAPKPNPIMFTTALTDNNLKVDQVWMVGDGESDVLGAKNVGMNSCFVNPSGSVPETVKRNTNMIVDNFNEFAGLIIKIRQYNDY